MDKTVNVWFTSEDAREHALSRQPDIAISPPAKAPAGPETSAAAITVDPGTRYQSILGIGSSFEEASVYHLWRMSPAVRHRVLRDLVHPEEGIGWNLMRICFGTSDFTSSPYYSYDDMPPGETDPDLTHFSIQHDIDLHILDVLKEAMALNPEMRFFASPWSPPGWMTSNDDLCGGRLLPEYFDVAARYYRMAVQAYQAQGIPIYAFTLQNEPLMVHPGYPTCHLSWEDEAEFVARVRKEFDRHNLDTQVWIFDHNFDHAMDYPGRILEDAAAYAATDGVAFHDYAGEPTAMSALHEAFPEMDLYFTEHSTWGTRGMDRILQYLRNWSKSYNAWVTCLNDVQEPNPGPHPCSPTFVMVSRMDPNDVRYIPEYYLLGQISRFVQSGARRVASDYGTADTVTNAAFMNPDGSTVLIAINQTRQPQEVTVACPAGHFTSTLPATTVATYRW